MSGTPLGDGTCGLPTEAELQRACGSLYITHGLESTCGLIMYVFFSVVAVKLHARSHLRSPAVAFLRFIFYHLYEFFDEFITTLYTVGTMHQQKLEARLRFCSNIDKMTNFASALLSLLGITRWLSIGNVNGMRYIGYALTCPLTQVELVVMLAPVIPCYKLAAFAAFGICFMTLTCGYVASLLWMPVWEGDLIQFIQTQDLNDLQPTDKAWAVLPAICGISTLFLILLPYYMTLYLIHGGGKNDDMPQEYCFLVMLVICSWVGFPCWWFLSWEGNGVITDTKINEVGFTILNMVAKGLFTLQSFRVGELNDARLSARRSGNGKRVSETSKGGKILKTSMSEWSDEGTYVPPIISRASSRKLSSSMFVKILRSYDEQSEEEDERSDSECEDSDSDASGRLHQAAKGRAGDRGRAPDTRGNPTRRPQSQGKGRR